MMTQISNADNFNVTTDHFTIGGDSATINADNFNVTTGERFHNRYNASISMRIASMLPQEKTSV